VIATTTASWSGPSGASVPPAWSLRIDAPTAASAVCAAAALLLLLQLIELRRRGLPVARPALAAATLFVFVAGWVVPREAWAALTDGDVNQDGRLDARDVLRALQIASGQFTASQAEKDHGDVAPLGAAPQNPSSIDAGDVALLMRGASGEDVDADGLNTDEEFAVGTSPFEADTDGDGVKDGVELMAGSNPLVADGNLDPDGDGLSNAQESALGTDPAFADTDGDGLPDGADPQPLASRVYQLRDHLGSVVLVVRQDTSVNGGIVRHSLYSAYGGVDFNGTPAPTSPVYPGTFGFTGQRFERSVALYDYNARWYEPQLGKFVQADSIVQAVFEPQSLNGYSYVVNDPLNEIDPSGNQHLCGDDICTDTPPIVTDDGGESGSYNPDIGFPGSDDHGPGSSLGELVHPISTPMLAPRPLTPREIVDQLWAPINLAFQRAHQAPDTRPMPPLIRAGNAFGPRDKVLFLDPIFQSDLAEVLQDLRERGYPDVMVAEGYRTQAEQRLKVIQGYSPAGSETYVSRYPGRHMSGRAADVILRRYGWGTPGGKGNPFWRDLGSAAENHGLIWGGRWRNRDVAHIELP